MIKRILIYIFIFLLISFNFLFSKNYSCNEIDSMIFGRFESGEYEIAYNMSKKNKDRENCSALFYFNLGKVFIRFDDFNTTRDLYNKAMKKSTDHEYKIIKLEYNKLSFLSSQINFIQSNYLNDGDKEKALSSYIALIKGNNQWDNGEPFIDSDKNMSYDTGEEFEDWNFDEIGLIYLYIADIYKNMQDYKNAIKYLNKARVINPYVKKYNNYIIIISKLIAQKGNNFLRLSQLDSAINQYVLSLSIDSTESTIYYNLANAYFKKEDYSNAIVSYKKVEQLNPEKFKAVHKIGACYQKIGLHEEAIIHFKKSIGLIESLNENFMSSYHSLGVSFMELQLYRDAIQILNEIITISPKYYKAYETLGVIFSESSDEKFINYDLALEHFIQASKLKPDNHIIKFRLSQLYNIIAEGKKENQHYRLMTQNLVEAKKYARQCLKLKKTYGGAYFELGVAELNLCNKSSSLKALKKAAKYDRRYRSEVKRIIKKINTIMNHCE